MAYREQDLAVRCPYCSASKGTWCRKNSIQRPVQTLPSPHKARVRKADQPSDNQGRAGRAVEEQQPRLVGWDITVDSDRGVTPMFLACRTKDGVLTGCKGPMVSAGYPQGPRPKHLGPPTLEWYRPEASPLGFFDENKDMEQHIRQGGLMLRPIHPSPERSNGERHIQS